MAEVAPLHLRSAELVKDDVASHAWRNHSEQAATRRLDSSCRFCFAETVVGLHNRRTVKSVTIQINDLFEFEGQPPPAQRPDNAVIEAMARRQFEFLRQPLQIEIGGNSVTVSFSEELHPRPGRERAKEIFTQPLDFLLRLGMGRLEPLVGNGERSSAKPKVREDRASGRERVNVAQAG
jgi:hypothetical protein